MTTVQPPSHIPETETALVLLAAIPGAEGDPARELFAQKYYAPVRAYMWAIIRPKLDIPDPQHSDKRVAERANRLVQAFFADRIFAGKLLTKYSRTQGPFRPYLKQSLRNYIIDDSRKQKGDGDVEFVDDSVLRGQAGRSAFAEADRAFDAEWVREIVNAAYERLAIETPVDQRVHLELFRARYVSDTRETFPELGKKYGVNASVAQGRVRTTALRFGKVLLSVLEERFGSRARAIEELETLRALLYDANQTDDAEN